MPRGGIKSPEHLEHCRQALIKRNKDPAFRELVSQAMKRRWQDPKYRAIHSRMAREQMLEYTQTPEGMEQSKRAGRARWEQMNPEEREKATKHMLSFPLTEVGKAEKVRKCREASLEQWQNLEIRANMIKNMSDALTGGHHLPMNEKARHKISEKAKKRWANPEFRQAVIPKCLTCQKPNKSEQFLIDFFQEHNLPFRYVGDGEFILGGRCPDFLNTNGNKQLIELFGAYWHPLFDTAKRTEHYKQYGFSLLVIWEDELEDKARLLKRIRTFSRRIKCINTA